MFYETSRVIQKQRKYLKTKANQVLQELKDSDLSDDEILACLDVMSHDDVSDTQKDIIDVAKNIVKSRQGLQNEESTYINHNDDDSNVMRSTS